MQAEALLRQSAEPERWLRLGDLLLAKEAWEESAGAFEQAGALGARPVDVLVGVSSVLISQGEWAAAAQILQQTLETYGGDARLYFNLGVVAQAQGDISAAGNFYNQAALLAPNWEAPQQALAQLE
jgi:tetratricopeptide (TPR) repeat protein